MQLTLQSCARTLLVLSAMVALTTAHESMAAGIEMPHGIYPSYFRAATAKDAQPQIVRGFREKLQKLEDVFNNAVNSVPGYLQDNDVYKLTSK